MTLNISNFLKTSLRAPVTATDTVLQLAVGTGQNFNFPAGDYCYITIEDRLATEIVKYVSVGGVNSDNIVVQRGQDGTVARAFPAGSCVKVAWNEQQVTDLILQVITAYSAGTCAPTNTVLVNAVPTTPPSACVQYAVYTPTALEVATANAAGVLPPAQALYYWTGTGWVKLSAYTGTSPVVVDPNTHRISLDLAALIPMIFNNVPCSVLQAALNRCGANTVTPSVTPVTPVTPVGGDVGGDVSGGVGVTGVGVTDVAVGTEPGPDGVSGVDGVDGVDGVGGDVSGA